MNATTCFKRDPFHC